MPTCQTCSAELEDDVLVGMFWCWRCSVYYWLDDDGFLRVADPLGGMPGTVRPSERYL